MNFKHLANFLFRIELFFTLTELCDSDWLLRKVVVSRASFTCNFQYDWRSSLQSLFFQSWLVAVSVTGEVFILKKVPAAACGWCVLFNGLDISCWGNEKTTLCENTDRSLLYEAYPSDTVVNLTCPLFRDRPLGGVLDRNWLDRSINRPYFPVICLLIPNVKLLYHFAE